MRRVVIEFPDAAGPPATYDVVDEYGRCCNGMSLGEMLEQLVGLALQGKARYQMLTEEGWQEWRDQRIARRIGNATPT